MMLSVTLGGLGMFLVVMALSFLATVIVTKESYNSDVENIISDQEEQDDDEVVNKDEIYIIKPSKVFNMY